MRNIISALLIVFSLELGAQTVIVADALFDSTTGSLKSNPRISIDGERIVAVNFGGTLPSGDVIDLRGHNTLPVAMSNTAINACQTLLLVMPCAELSTPKIP